MRDKPLFSIITINYNDHLGLERTLLNALNQSYTNFEYIVIDGGSTDESTTIIQRYQDRIDYWVSEPDQGVYDAMNKGLQQVNGNYVYFLNSGDAFYSESTLLEIERYIRAQNLPDIVYGDVIYVNPETKAETPSNFKVDKIALYNKMICHQAMFCQKHIFDNIGGFDTVFKIKADYDWLLRALFHGASIHKAHMMVAYYEEGGLSETQFNRYSVKEIPVIRGLYYTAKEEKFIRRFFFHPQIMKLPLYNVYRKTLINITKLFNSKFK
jgi:glycosyltransferase involved in cell wall biosynthesis